jgi:hypothetical protein
MAKRALLIGVNEYEHVSSLSGCLNDVELVARVLDEHYGFEDSGLTRVVDPDNTRADILAAFDAFVRETRDEDTVLVYYSGHGSQSHDREEEEPDAFDETIVPRDSGRGPAPNRDITDDEINSVVLALAATGAAVNVIFDSCHSGTATRRALRPPPEGAVPRWVVPDRRPPSESAHLQPQAGDETGSDRGSSGWIPTGTHIFVSGCEADELSNEYPIGGRQQGALTYHLCQQLIRGSGLTWRTAIEAAGAAVSADFPEQHPQLEAPDAKRDSAPFGA